MSRGKRVGLGRERSTRRDDGGADADGSACNAADDEDEWWARPIGSDDEVEEWHAGIDAGGGDGAATGDENACGVGDDAADENACGVGDDAADKNAYWEGDDAGEYPSGEEGNDAGEWTYAALSMPIKLLFSWRCQLAGRWSRRGPVRCR
ncbi:hypothetical protein CLOM_g17561 [Closterium sp. NIES-68]|nr:hypothetical protein CLOM_g17561 [Closterium sp. NIES-68]